MQICAMILPPNLQPGDVIGIVCPSGYMPFENMHSCIQTLSAWGFEVKLGKTAGGKYHYFSGNDEERLADFQQMLDDTAIQAILFGRGGYGLSRIIDKIDFSRFIKNPKWLIGYSDITLLHNHLSARYNIISLHAPMAAAFNDGGAENIYVQSIRKIISGEEVKYIIPTHPFNKAGTASGILTGGNLAMLAHSIGTPSFVNTNGKILFIEDVGEYIYGIDRMILQLKRAGVFENLAGLIVGSFTDMKDTVIPFGKDVYDCVAEHISKYSYPVCFGFPVGHATENFPMQCGRKHQLIITNESVQLHYN